MRSDVVRLTGFSRAIVKKYVSRFRANRQTDMRGRSEIIDALENPPEQSAELQETRGCDCIGPFPSHITVSIYIQRIDHRTSPKHPSDNPGHSLGALFANSRASSSRETDAPIISQINI